MKIVQSLWSKPSFKTENLHLSDRNKGGWADERYNYFSWALSCLRFKQHYSEIELVTDKQGYELLVNKLQLPYTTVHVVLDELNHYHLDLWALGKIYAYSMQDEPFIHADGDIYIWEKFSNELESAPLLAQNAEAGFVYYEEVFKKITEHFEFIPPEFAASRERNKQIIAVNAGLIGGTRYDFFKQYKQLAFEFVNRNMEGLSKMNMGVSNIIFEQFLFKAMAEEQGIDITYLFTNINHAFDGLCELTGAPRKIKYAHPIGAYKRVKYIGELVAHHLLQEYPEYYYKILHLLRTHQI